jgi:hypothetical protein
MAGIKETKDQLRKEILELYKRFTATKPDELISGQKSAAQLDELAVLSSTLTKKIEAFAYLAAIEEAYPEIAIVPPVANIIPPVEKIIPPVENIVPPVEKIVPPAPEIKTPEIIPVVEKNIPIVPVNHHPEFVQAPPAQGGKNYPDLKTFIGLNEKLMFVRSLFNTSGTDYENAIAEVNHCHSYKEAEAVLQNFSATYKWLPESEPVQVFYSIVKRRFA